MQRNIAVILYISLFFSLFHISCNKTSKMFAKTTDVVFKKGVHPFIDKNQQAPCKTSSNYAPNEKYPDHTPVRYVKVNFHFVDNEDRSANFNNKEGENYVINLLDIANKQLRNNKPMHLPAENNTPILEPRFQYVLTPDRSKVGDKGIYFHQDEALAFLNTQDKGGPLGLYSNALYDKYGVQKKEVLNIFLIEHHPDSLASSTYKNASNGIGKPYFAKMSNCYYNHVKTAESDGSVSKGFWYMAKLLNHEVGHSMGLIHSWVKNDGCEDTPPHPNCWNYTSSGACQKEVSNNVMDYNAFGNSWTPCQIGKVQYNMSKDGSSQRGFLVEDYCEYSAEKSITIRDEVNWFSSKDMLGNIIIKAGGVLHLHCSLSMPKLSKIMVEPGGKLVLNGARLFNRCNETWDGIQLLEKNGNKGELIVYDTPSVLNSKYPLSF